MVKTNMEISGLNRLAFLFFDSQSSLDAFQRTPFSRSRRSLGVTTICVTSDDVVEPDKANEYDFDHVTVLRASDMAHMPCGISVADAIETVSATCALLGVMRMRDVSIVSCGEFTSDVAASIRETLQIHGPTIADAALFRDKIKMKQRLAGIVSTPAMCEVSRSRIAVAPEQEFDRLVAELGKPLVVKPVSMSSSFGVTVVRDYKDFDRALALVATFQGRLEAETFIAGSQLHCETLFLGREPVLSLVCRFNSPQLDMMRGRNVGTMTLAPEDPVALAAASHARVASRALGACDTITHVEMMMRENGGIVFIEAASRVPGGDVINRYRHSFGVDLLDLDQRLKCGLPIELPILPTHPEMSFWVYIAAPEGRVRSLRTPELRSRSETSWFVSPGDVLTCSKTFEEPAGMIIAYNSIPNILSEDFERLLDMCLIDTDDASLDDCTTHFGSELDRSVPKQSGEAHGVVG
jgi:biotin carboxylase